MREKKRDRLTVSHHLSNDLAYSVGANGREDVVPKRLPVRCPEVFASKKIIPLPGTNPIKHRLLLSVKLVFTTSRNQVDFFEPQKGE